MYLEAEATLRGAMVSARQLYELQRLEGAVQQQQKTLRAVEVRLADHQDVDRARLEMGVQNQHMEKLRVALRDQELIQQTFVERIQNLERRLYGGGTTNSKELVSFQQELAQFKRNHDSGEYHLLELMIQVEEAQSKASESEEAFTKASKKWEAQNQELLERRDRLTQELAELDSEEQATRGLLERQELDRYQALRKSRGTAVAKVESGICRGCGLAIPSQELQRARMSRALVQCSSCGRILYVS